MTKQQLCCVLLLLITGHLIDATIPTIDNIVKILQSPTLQQIIVPQAFVAADSPETTASSNETNSVKNMPQNDSPAQMDETPTLKLVTRVLDTLRSPKPARQVLLVPQRRALPGCPLCDASVYSYCDYKVYHDGCCCGTTNHGYGQGFGGGFSNGIGYGGCGYQEDCSFIYANSCYEHQLIVNCCCNSPY